MRKDAITVKESNKYLKICLTNTIQMSDKIRPYL